MIQILNLSIYQKLLTINLKKMTGTIVIISLTSLDHNTYHVRPIVINEMSRSKKIMTDLYFFKLQCIVGISIKFQCSSLKEKFIRKSFKFMAPSIDTSNISKTEISWISVQHLRNYERNESTSRRVIVGGRVS